MLQLKDWLFSPHETLGLEKVELKDHVEAPPIIHHTELLHMRITKRYGLVNITRAIEDIVSRSNVSDGFCFVSTLHITAGIYVNDAESGLLQDIAQWIENIAPYGKNYKHHQTGEDNADAHLKSYLTNHFLTAPITRNKLDFGTWQQIFYAEFDGQRNKKILVKITGLRI